MGEGAHNSGQNKHRQGGPSRYPQRDAEYDGDEGDEEHAATNTKKTRECTSNQATEYGFYHMEIVVVRHTPYDALAM
jgi:hypothetical protein